MMKLHVLASGSRGNAAIVENGRTGQGVLVDCGICKREFLERTAACGFDLSGLAAVVITHDHGDHVKGLGVVLRGLAKAGVRPAVYASEAVLAASAPLCDAVASVGASCRVFAAGDRLSLAGLVVRPFATSHDAAASFGFRFDEPAPSAGEGGALAPEIASDALGFVTDTGFLTDGAARALAGVRLLALESNHDERMLREGPYPYRSSSGSPRIGAIFPTNRPPGPWRRWPTRGLRPSWPCTCLKRTTPIACPARRWSGLLPKRLRLWHRRCA